MTDFQDIVRGANAEHEKWATISGLADCFDSVAMDAERVRDILRAAADGPLTVEQRFHLQQSMQMIAAFAEDEFCTGLFLPPDEYQRQNDIFLSTPIPPLNA
jgi:hypothetical protein